MIKKFTASFLNALAPTLEKRTVLSDLDSLFQEINDATIKMFVAIDDDRQVLPAYKAIHAGLKGQSGKLSAHNAILEVLERISGAQSDIVKYAEKSFSGLIVKEALDYQKLNMLSYTNALRFFNKYALSLIHI